MPFRIIICASLLLFSCTLTFGQKFRGGIIAGISSSQVSGDDLAGFNKAGLVFGGSASLKMNDYISSQFEIIYIEKGSRKNARVDRDDFWDYRLNLNYIEVPLMFAYHFKNKIQIQAGPSFATLIKTKEESTDVTGALPLNPQPFIKTEACVAMGIAYPLSDHFRMNWRFINSVTPLRKHASLETRGVNRGQYNTAMTFTLRYEFNRGNGN